MNVLTTVSVKILRVTTSVYAALDFWIWARGVKVGEVLTTDNFIDLNSTYFYIRTSQEASSL